MIFFSLKIYSKKHRGSYRIENKSALRESENTAPNILFKKLNIIYKSIFHKQLYRYIFTWKSYYKGDTSFVHIDSPAKVFTLSTWSVIGAGRSSARSSWEHERQVWLCLTCDLLISSLGETWGGVGSGGCIPGRPHPHHPQWHRADGTRAGQLDFNPKRRSLAAEAQASGPSLSPRSVLAYPCPSSPSQLPIPSVEWRDEVFGYAESIIWWGKNKIKETDWEALGAWASAVWLWTC